MNRPLGGAFAPLDMPGESQHRRLIAEAANAALRGETHNTGNFTAPAGADNFILEGPRLGIGKVLQLTPRNAAAAVSGWFVSEVQNGTAIIVFNAPLAADAAFDFVVAGVGAGA